MAAVRCEHHRPGQLPVNCWSDGNSNRNRVTGDGADGLIRQATNAVRPQAAQGWPPRPDVRASVDHVEENGRRVRLRLSPLALWLRRVSRSASPISRSRRRGSFSRQRRSSLRIGAGVAAGSALHSGSLRDHDAERLRHVVAVERPRGRSASRRARSRTPRCRARLSAACPRACSGTHVRRGAEIIPAPWSPAGLVSVGDRDVLPDGRASRARSPLPGRSRAP